MSIIIASRNESREIAKNNSKKYNFISILEPDMEVPEEIKEHALNYIVFNFHDIEYIHNGYTHPTEQNVREAIEWGKDKENLIVACRAGRSRSSAIAYLIQCYKHPPKSAINILGPRHIPNSLIVKLGAKILNNQDILDEYHQWMAKSALDELTFDEIN